MKHQLARTRKNVTACDKVTEDVQKMFKKKLGKSCSKEIVLMMMLWSVLKRKNILHLKEGLWINFLAKERENKSLCPRW